MAMPSNMGSYSYATPQTAGPVRRGPEGHAPQGPLRDVTVKDVKDTINKLWIEPWKVGRLPRAPNCYYPRPGGRREVCEAHYKYGAKYNVSRLDFIRGSLLFPDAALNNAGACARGGRQRHYGRDKGNMAGSVEGTRGPGFALASSLSLSSGHPLLRHLNLRACAPYCARLRPNTCA